VDNRGVLFEEMQAYRHEPEKRERKVHPPLGPEGREAVLGALRERLLEEDTVAFAYAHGSFLTGRVFHDVDLAVYSSAEGNLDLSYELGLEVELEQILREAGYPFPVDVRLLNRAPLAFRYRVIREGFLLFARDEALRAYFEAGTFSQYFDFAPFQQAYLREVLGLGASLR
jgi:hypothetical protein